MIPLGTNLERRKLPVATLGLIGANILVFAAELLLPEETLKRTFTQFGFGPATRNPLAPFTALFLHADIYHIAFNMLFLWIFGGPVEERIGSRQLLKYYFGAGLFAGILSTVMELIARPGSSVPGIGASGAVSGVMAIFLYRCFYAKMKMVIAPLLLPRQVNVPVVPLVLFWFFQDVVMGIFSLTVPTGIGHWAHVGGFAFGIAVGRIKRYGHEGQVEQLRTRIHQKLAEGGGWKAAEKDLLKLLEKSPDDPEVHQDLARLYAQQGQAGLAERHYTTAVQRHFLRQPLDAAYIVIEHHDALSRPMQPPYLLKAAEALVKDMAYEDAHKVLLPLAGAANPTGQIAEKALALFIRLSRHLGRDDDAGRASRLFQAHFPSSRFRPEINAALSKKPGTIFPSPPAAAGDRAAPEDGRSLAAKEADRLGAIDVVERIIADPAFWLILLGLNLFAPFFFPRLYFSRLSPLYIFAAAFGMTIVHRMGSIGDLLRNAPSEKEARREVELQRHFDNAVMAEKGEQYEAAAANYEKCLAGDPGNIQARFSAARLYHKRLNRAADARRHYQFLEKNAPRQHPFRAEAEDALKELKA